MVLALPRMLGHRLGRACSEQRDAARRPLVGDGDLVDGAGRGCSRSVALRAAGRSAIAYMLVPARPAGRPVGAGRGPRASRSRRGVAVAHRAGAGRRPRRGRGGRASATLPPDRALRGRHPRPGAVPAEPLARVGDGPLTEGQRGQTRALRAEGDAAAPRPSRARAGDGARDRPAPAPAASPAPTDRRSTDRRPPAATAHAASPTRGSSRSTSRCRPSEGDNQALAVNTTDGTVVYDVAFAMVWVDGDEPVTNTNEAYAAASCTTARPWRSASRWCWSSATRTSSCPQNLADRGQLRLRAVPDLRAGQPAGRHPRRSAERRRDGGAAELWAEIARVRRAASPAAASPSSRARSRASRTRSSRSSTTTPRGRPTTTRRPPSRARRRASRRAPSRARAERGAVGGAERVPERASPASRRRPRRCRAGRPTRRRARRSSRRRPRRSWRRPRRDAAVLTSGARAGHGGRLLVSDARHRGSPP